MNIRQNTGYDAVVDDSVVCCDDISTTLEYLPLESNAIAVAVHYSLPSCPIRLLYLHTCIPFTSPCCLCITDSAKHFNELSAVCYIMDDSWAGSHVVPRILHWLLTEEVKKGQILWVHTYPTTSSRRRGRHV
jgi:hypothetical protein